MVQIKVAAALLLVFSWKNFRTYRLFARDKQLAIEGARRIPERKLLGSAFWGGSVGAKLAQKRLRHKTYKQPFGIRLNLICIVHALLLIWAIYSGFWGFIVETANNPVETLRQVVFEVGAVLEPFFEPPEPEQIRPRRFGPGS